LLHFFVLTDAAERFDSGDPIEPMNVEGNLSPPGMQAADLFFFFQP
jgi:hypothetical protein